MEERRYELGHEHVGRLLIRYSTPAIVAMCVNSLYNLVDAIFVGQGVGPMALAGLAVAFPIQMITLATAHVIGIGSASVISRSLGAGDTRRADRTAGSSFLYVAVLSIFLTVLGLMFLRPLLRCFGATEAIMPYAYEYMSVIFMGSIFFTFAVSANCLVRSEGNTKAAMVSMLIGGITNTILDPIFIFGFKWGVWGAAVATVIANIGSAMYLLHFFMHGKSMLHITFANLKPSFDILPEVLRIGSASFTRVAAGSLVAIAINTTIIHYGQDLHLAVLGVANRLFTFLFMPLIGLVQGMQPIVGFNYGAKNWHRVRETVIKAVLAASAVSILGFLLLELFPERIVGLFGNDPFLIEEGSNIIRILSIGLPLVGFQIVGSSMFEALGKALPTHVLSMSRQILFLLPLVFVLPWFFGILGVWLSFATADILSAVVTAGLFIPTLYRLDQKGRENREKDAVLPSEAIK